MDFGFTYEPIGETNRRNPLALAPPALTVQTPQSRAIPD